MNFITKSMRFIHRILGTALSILFLVWFLSGIVMIYHTFPRVYANEQIAHMESLGSESLPCIDSIQARLPQGEELRGLSVNRFLGQTIIHVQTSKGVIDLPANNGESLPDVNWDLVERTAKAWCDAPVAKVDTLRDLEQWIPFGSMRKDLPIYKFHFDDEARTQLFISSQTGKVLQETTRENRFWAWLGAIPHWVYFTWLRQDSKLWSDVVVWLSGIGCIMVIAGIYMGVRSWLFARKRGKGLSPYKNRWFRWHHVTGFVFGLFALTFAYSGMMSLASVQDFGIKPKLDFNPSMALRQMKPLPQTYVTDYRSAIAVYPEVRQIDWSSWGSVPFYTLHMPQNKKLYIDARCTEVKPLNMSQNDIETVIRQIHGDQAAISSSMLQEYDNYYINRKRSLPLPVWKVKVSDADNSTYYVDPQSGQQRYMSTPGRLNFISYQALHTLSFKVLVDHPTLWYIVMWMLQLGGAIVSATGVWLAVKYLIRLFKKARKGNF